MKFKIIKLISVRSTNEFAIKIIKNKKIKYGLVHSKEQTKGKGTYGKNWVSQEGNLFASIFFPLKKRYPPFNEFTLINAILISKAIKYFCKKSKVNLKFPNDIFLNKKKVCGILQEVITLNNNKFLIIGIGINTVINPDIKKKYRATNILLETKKKISNYKIINLIKYSYEHFLTNIESYNYISFKKKSEQMV